MKGINDAFSLVGNRLLISSNFNRYSNLYLSFFIISSPFVLYVIVGIILWFITEKISNYIIPNENTYEESVINYSKDTLVDIQVIAFSIIGLIIVLFDFNSIFQVIGGIALAGTHTGMEEILNLFKVNLGGKTITFIFGLILVLKPRKIASLLKTI